VETNGFSGEIIDINLRNIKLRELDNNIVLLPNKSVTDNPMKNYGLTREIRSSIKCGVDYSSDLELVERITKKTIRELYPSQDPKRIEFYYTQFGKSSIDFILRFWHDGTNEASALVVRSDAIKAIKAAFDEHDITIPYPVTTLVRAKVK